MVILVYLVIIVMIAIFGYKQFKHNFNKTEVVTFSFIMATNLTITLFYFMDFPMKSPLDLISFIFKPLTTTFGLF